MSGSVAPGLNDDQKCFLFDQSVEALSDLVTDLRGATTDEGKQELLNDLMYC